MFAGLIAATALVASMHTASIPAPDGTIDGCYSNITHALFVEDSNGSCPLLTTPLNWSQTGPQGPVGPTGATGPQGVGSNFYRVESIQDVTTWTTQTSISLSVFCNSPSDFVISGGYDFYIGEDDGVEDYIPFPGLTVSVDSVVPGDPDTGTTWHYEFDASFTAGSIPGDPNALGHHSEFAAWATCETPSS